MEKVLSLSHFKDKESEAQIRQVTSQGLITKTCQT